MESEVEELNEVVAVQEPKEFIRRCKKNYEFKMLDEEDLEIFRNINPDIIKQEEKTGQTYVYLTLDKYRRMELAAKKHYSMSGIAAFAGINYNKFRKLQLKYPLLRGRIDQWRENLINCAQDVVVKAITEDKDVDTAKWALERLNRRDYAKNVEVNVNGNVTHTHKVDMEQVKSIRGSLKKLRVNDESEVIDV